LTEHRRTPEGIELLHWSRFAHAPATLDAYDVVVYNIGDHFRFHAGVLGLIDRYPGVCIFHDFYLVNLFRAWCERGLERPMANSIVSSTYGEEVANEFWKRIGHPDFVDWSASRAPMTGWIARKALAAVAHASFYERLLSEWSAGPVRVIPLAYTASVCAPHLQVQHANGRLHILTVGRVIPNKRVAEVIRSVASSPFLRCRCEYHVVGDIEAPERNRLLSLINQFGLQEVVHLHGEVSDFELRWRYAEADIVCCLRWPALEGASASCVEAMLHGKAVIATDTGFYSSIPSDRILKVRPTDEIRDLVEHLEMLVVNSDVRDSFGQAGPGVG
jgi:glycosyltransferase involved in cell wall biosynthesis